MQTSSFVPWIVAAVALFWAVGAYNRLVRLRSDANAAFAALEAELTKQVKLVGTVKAFRWQNPHTWLEVDVPGPKGKVETWGVEMTSPTYLVRAGWKNNSVKAGDKVTVIVNPLREGDIKSGIFVSITLADGRTLGEQPASLGGSAPKK